MANLLENMLSGGKVRRQDDKHLAIVQRPLPVRPRQLFEVFAALGQTANFPALRRSLEIKGADPHQVIFITLGRWPTLEEAANLPDPYEPGPHLTALMRSQEFRRGMAHRACEAFPERKRLLFVRIPRSGGGSVLEMIGGRHPLLPLDLTARRYDDPETLARTLGEVFARTATSNWLGMAHTSMAPFLDPPGPRRVKDDPFAWGGVMPPARIGDTLFTVLRDPQARAFGEVNAHLLAWRSGERDLPADMGARLGVPAGRARPQDWRRLGGEILAASALRNPVCAALGDGTCEGALQACSRSPIQLVQLEQLNQWARAGLENMTSNPPPAGEPIVRPQDLTAAQADALAEATREDTALYARFIKRIKETELPVAMGRQI